MSGSLLLDNVALRICCVGSRLSDMASFEYSSAIIFFFFKYKRNRKGEGNLKLQMNIYTYIYTSNIILTSYENLIW